ncbi:hypothetical protein BH23VER1_BH23VER1_15340 [soil metagenome]
MKPARLPSIALALSGAACFLLTASGTLAQKPADQATDPTSDRTASAPYRHVVLFQFKEDAPDAAVKAVEDAFVALKDKIDLIKDFEWGRNVSPEGLDGGFTHVYFVTFKDKADLEKYLPHPEHKKFVAMLGDVLEKATVVDYVARTE